jgi:hypothetical protein
MNVRALCYLSVFVFGLILIYIQYEGYITQVGATVTIPILGIYEIPREAFPAAFMSSAILIPWSLANALGAYLNADWLFPSRVFATIIAVNLMTIGWLYTSIYEGGSGYLSVALLYLMAEGFATIKEVIS